MPLNITEWKIEILFTQIIRRRALLMLLCLVPLALSACTAGKAFATPTSLSPQVPTPTHPTATHQSKTATRTLLPTSSPAATATVEATHTPQYTEMPPVPSPVSGQVYQLTNWTPEKAEQLILTLKNYPETLENNGQAVIYFPGFQYEGVAELESALRFPQSDQKKNVALGWGLQPVSIR